MTAFSAAAPASSPPRRRSTENHPPPRTHPLPTLYPQDTVGYILHSLLLVPYFSWQRSHAVHHSRTNHIDEGETHVPMKASEPDGKFTLAMKRLLGPDAFGVVNLFGVLAFGWPVYLLTGASGGPVRGKTNHFWPWAGAQARGAWEPLPARPAHTPPLHPLPATLN